MFPLRILYGFLIIIVLTLAVPFPAAAITISPNNPVQDSVNSTTMNTTAPTQVPAMLAPPEQPTTPVPVPAKEYNRGYPIPVPFLIITFIIVLAAGGFMVRRRRFRR